MNYKFLVFLLFTSSCVAFDFVDRPSSHNFVIRWGFQELCDFVYDHRIVWPTNKKEGTSFDPSQVKPGDMIFVRDAQQFFKKMHPEITVPYFILTHGEYLDKFKASSFKYLEDEKILGWFTIHPCEVSHVRVFPLPLGVVQYKEIFQDAVNQDKRFATLRENKKEKLLYMNFTDWGNPARKKIRDYFAGKPFVTNCSACHFEKYIKDVARHKFVLSPPGLGPDCYRVWESILVGTIPIVKHSHLDSFYEGLPILFINDWSEVTEEFLEEKYREITSKKYSCKKLYMEYWIRTITKTRERLFPQLKAGRTLKKAKRQ